MHSVNPKYYTKRNDFMRKLLTFVTPLSLMLIENHLKSDGGFDPKDIDKDALKDAMLGAGAHAISHMDIKNKDAATFSDFLSEDDINFFVGVFEQSAVSVLKFSQNLLEPVAVEEVAEEVKEEECLESSE